MRKARSTYKNILLYALPNNDISRKSKDIKQRTA